ncbi:branched-chain amino acid ABC transporter permease [Nocardioides acrostichi]|uniref:Branched-chain amino acid ABC transporter permease n=1 Tax=Nocardioides acrostichi TaxID=2784339 RepID=A0A930UVE9_9ACTN|nr:branched-chain amino acid ABC transporter permease [Nocardioides acrostichi]MBF4161568.1 branched-chain amino acid ABC transporter permease [Nocardioides acrostichi]
MDYWIALLLNAISFGMVLFLLSAGLTLTLGTMRLLNLTHGSFFLVGAYVTFELERHGVDLALAWGAAVLATALCGAVVFVLLRPTGEDHLRQTLLTFGVLFVIADAALVIVGGDPAILPRPGFLEGTLDLGLLDYPKYRLFLVAVGLGMAGLLFWFQYRTRAGMMLRAVVDDPEMARGVGINPTVLAAVTFVVGAGIAGLSGALGGVLLGAFPGVDLQVLLFALVVVIVGGAGSIGGALAGSVVIGLVNTVTIAFAPGLALFSMFGVMLAILTLRPQGIAGKALA